MATVLPETKPSSPDSEPSGTGQLEDKLPERLRAPRVLAALTAVVGITFLLAAYQPLWHTDLWGHLAYGQHLWKTGAFPDTEPLMPLASGVPFVDTAWLSQLIAYGAHESLGVEALRFLYAAAVAVCLGLLLGQCYRRTRHVVWSLLGCGAFAWVGWQHLVIVRPQLAGLACFLGLLVLLTSHRHARVWWVAVPVLFAVWANLHGSFPVGLATLAAFCLGRAVDVFRRTRRLSFVFRDDYVRRYFLLIELAAVAVLMNPYGWRLYAAVLSIPGNANLSDLVEWNPLHLRMRQGQAAAAIALALMFLYRLSPRRVSAAEVLLLLGLGGAALWTSRLIVWWAPVAGYCLALHGWAVWRQRRSLPLSPRPSPRSGKWAVVTVGLVWICFAYTPFAGKLLHGRETEFEKIVARQTPVGAAEYLRENPPQGQVFNTYEWGDYLLWAGPPQLQVFVASHAHLVPRDVWRDYMGVIGGRAGWEETLGRYGVNTIVLDYRYREGLIRRLKREEGWRLAYDDERGAVFERRESEQ